MVLALGPEVPFIAMRIPEPLFAVINIAVRALLMSPFHALMSSSILLISYTGRKSGKAYTTPVRYVRTDRGVRCFTSEEVQWWRNVRANPVVTLRVRGVPGQYQAKILEGDVESIRRRLIDYFAIFPQDAAYHDIRRSRDGSLDGNDLDRASREAIVVDFEEIRAQSPAAGFNRQEESP